MGNLNIDLKSAALMNNHFFDKCPELSLLLSLIFFLQPAIIQR